jgi:hypothetical protein
MGLRGRNSQGLYKILQKIAADKSGKPKKSIGNLLSILDKL